MVYCIPLKPFTIVAFVVFVSVFNLNLILV